MTAFIISSGIIHGKKGSKVSEESAIVIRGITTTQENIREIKYTLSERACRQLYERKWITDEVINSYMSLISAKRSKNSYNEAHFHFFDSLFFFKLNHLVATSTYNFLHFTPFLNRLNSQVLTPRSVLLFLLNNEDFDYALLGVDLL